MKEKLIFIYVVLLLGMALSSRAQTNMAFYALEDQFNSSDFNPAFLSSSHQFTLGIFPLAGTNIGYNDQQVIRQLVRKVISGITTDKDYQDILESMARRDKINQNIESSLLNFTWKTNAGFLNFRIKEVENFSVALKGELTDFIILPGAQSVTAGKSQYLPAQGLHYREYSFGYSIPSGNHRFSAGFRAKLYFGKASFDSDLSGALYDESGNYILRTSGKVNMSVPEIKVADNDPASSGSSGKISAGSYLFQSGNRGFGADLGLNYYITPELSVSLSMIDLGKINWKTKLNSKSFNVAHQFNPDSLTSTTTETGAEIISKKYSDPLVEPLAKEFNPEIDRETPFTITIPLNIYSGVKYRIGDFAAVSLVNKYTRIKNLSYNSTSLLASYDFKHKISVVTGYSIINNSYYNFPVAVLFKKDFGQFYFGTDNIATLFLNSSADFAGATFGLCFYLFRKKEKILDRYEEFPFYQPRLIRKQKKKGLLY